MTIECGSGRVLFPIIGAPDEDAAREKGLLLGDELCKVAPRGPGAPRPTWDSPPCAPPVVTDVRRLHRWWTE